MPEINNKQLNQDKPSLNKKFNALLKSQLIPVVIISFIIGGLSGGLVGLLTNNLSQTAAGRWFTGPLGQNNNTQSSNETIEIPSGNSPTAPVAGSAEEATIQAVKKVSPAVVSIVITKEIQQYYNNGALNLPNDFFDLNFPFDQFFNSPQPMPGPKEKQKVGGGTGFIITADGLLITNKHVVADTTAEYSVVMNDTKTYQAKVVARDPFNDLAFLRIEASGLPTVVLGDSDKLQIGQSVMAIGFSLGEYSNSVTRGIISGKGRDIVAGGNGASEKLEGVIQTDAAINPGNSGGPLINLAGEVVGINTAINQSGQLIGFAIPINSIKSAVKSVQEKGKIVRAYLGLRYVVINEEIAKKNNLTVNYGVLLVRGQVASELAVLPGSPADKAGLVENDIILEISAIGGSASGGNGWLKLDASHSLAQEVAKHQPGETISLKVLSKGTEKTVSVKLEEYPG